MRITGGVLGGRRLVVPKSGVRPTQDRVREACFSSLGPTIVDARVLDLFAGSGANGIEAWSRGAGEVVWVESHPSTYEVMKSNVQSLCGTESAGACRRGDVFTLLKQDDGGRVFGAPFDFILADPPYERHSPTSDAERFLTLLASTNWLKEDGLLVFEQRATNPIISHPAWGVVREKKYGEARLIYYKRAPTGEE